MRQLERKIRMHFSGINTVLRRVSFIPDDGLHISRNVKKILFSIIVAILLAIRIYSDSVHCLPKF